MIDHHCHSISCRYINDDRDIPDSKPTANSQSDGLLAESRDLFVDMQYIDSSYLLSVKGVVGILQDEITGSIEGRLLTSDDRVTQPILSGVILSNCRFLNCLHPITDDHLIIRAEVTCAVHFVLNADSILPRAHSLVHSDLIPDLI